MVRVLELDNRSSAHGYPERYLAEKLQALMLEKSTAIQTSGAGIISGRDAIYLDSVRFPNLVTVKFVGSLNASLCDGLDQCDDFVPYNLTFCSVVWFKLSELDFAGLDAVNIDDSTSSFGESSFDVIENSNLVSTFQDADHSSKISDEHEHYVLYTCDIVFEIIATDYNLVLGEADRKSKA